MKRFLSFLATVALLCALAVPVYAQGHLKFMGIPIDGSIDNFQSKLAAKGVKVNPAENKTAPFGQRIFKGNFAGQPCRILAFYDQSKNVYRALAVYHVTSETQADQFYAQAKKMLETQYADEYAEEDTYNGYPAYSVLVIEDSQDASKGVIDLYKAKIQDEGEPVEYWIYVDYQDTLNKSKKEQQD